MEEKEMEEYTDIMRKNGVNTMTHSWGELIEIAKAMEEYHQNKLKLFIGNIIGVTRSEKKKP
jgi:predicted RNA-binding protein with PUA domain